MPFENSIPNQIIWVSPDGDDSNTGSRDAPLQSIQLAIDRATPGTAIMLLPGDYSGNFEFDRTEGTEDNPIWLAAAEGPGTVTITAADDTKSIITIQGEDNLVIRDLVLVGGFDGIEINQSGHDHTNLVNNILIEGNTIIGAAWDGIKVGETTNVVIRNNVVNGAGDQGIDCLGVVNAVIDGNEISNVTGTASALFVKGGSSEVLITNNYIHDVEGDGLCIGGSTGAQWFLPGTDYEAKNVVATGNVVENAAKRPLTVRGAQDVDIYGNFFGSMDSNETVILIGAGSPELSPPPPSARVSIHDNVFDRSNSFANIQPSSTEISIFDNVKDGIVEGDMRPFPPDPDPDSFVDSLPQSLLDAPLWSTSARSDNSVRGTSDDDTLTGTDGHDNISGGSGDDIMVGRAGDDVYSIGSSRDHVIEALNNGLDTANVHVKAYTLEANVENLAVKYTSGGTYQGNELNNIITGGAGGDTLTGALGDDLFVPSGGNDRLTDFEAGQGNGDRVDLRSFATFVGLADVVAAATQVGADTVIDLGSGRTLTLVNVALDNLAEDDFLFTIVAPPVDVNEPPTNIAISNDAVAEGSAAGTVVGSLSTADPDEGDSFVYALIDDTDGTFAIDGGNLVVAGALDYETAPSRTVTVRVTDSAGNSFDKSLTINLTNAAPVAPFDADGAANEISENTINGAAVGIVASSSDVAGGTVTYTLVDDAGGRFAVDAVTGQVTVADASLIDYETATEHTIVVQASDANGAAGTSSFTIGVNNWAPATPADLDDGANEIAEGAINGSVVGIVATAADVNGGAVSYTLLDDAGGRFSIDVATGQVTVADQGLIDYETAALHTIVVQASDASGATSKASFTIGVTNTEPLAPEDSDGGSNQIAEDAATGTAVGITASAEDINGGAVSYSLIDDAGGRFAIDATTGLVTVADGSLLDYETATEHMIVVQATDAGGSTSTASFTVGVVNGAPAAPEDADDAPNSVAEGAEDGAAVGIAVVSPQTNGGAVTYSLLDDADGRFAIDAKTGVVTVRDGALLDYETATEHSITVQASDTSGAASTANFTIAIANKAPTTPEDLDESADRVVEGAVNGTTVGIAVSAADINSGGITYSLLNDAGGRFAIDATTGVVSVADGSLIDYETVTEHTIVIQASDAAGASNTATFTIAVGDKAPTAPEDLDAAPNRVAENAANGTAVGIRAAASDINGGLVTYSLLDAAAGRFAIDATSGLVTVADGSLIDYETAAEHTIVVKATDAFGATSTTNFLITVGDVGGVTITGTSGSDNITSTATVPPGVFPTEEGDLISGRSGNDLISAYGGDDTIDGGSGADRMYGGKGNDTYIVSSNSDKVIELAGEGIDHVRSADNLTLAANVENLTLTGSSGISGTGNELANVITGNSANNTLSGLGGADTLIGGLGTDTATYVASQAGVSISLATGRGSGGDAEGDTLTQIERLTGSRFDDVLEGSSGNNALSGGDGIDTVSYANSVAGVTVRLDTTSAQATGGSGSDSLSGFENVTGSSFADTLRGNSSDNSLSGLDGNDKLIGGWGADTLVGGAGNDQLCGGGGADTFVWEFATDGLDTILDFASGEDLLAISAMGFGGGLAAGDAASLVTVDDIAAALGSAGEGYFIFDNSGDSAGTIYWDTTGGASDDAVAFARINAGTSLIPSDFHVV